MIAVIFPGQGSQKPGMGKELYESVPEAKEVFEQVQKATEMDIRRICFDLNEDELRQTQNAQLALYTCGVAAYRALRARTTTRVSVAAGHSVGEFAALAAAGFFTVEQGAKLVQTRGILMADAGMMAPGTMAAVLGLERPELEQICRETEGCVVIANDNCPGQLVISGEVYAVNKAGEKAKEQGAKRVLPLNVSGAFHSPLMEEPAEQFAKELAEADFSPEGGLKVYANVTSEPVESGSEWPDVLQRQLMSPVRWTESVEHMLRDGVKTFIECGSGEVLSGLIRRIDKEAQALKVYDNESLEAVAAVQGAGV